MSDFFGDDFTAELKAYFLGSLLKEADNFIDLIDNSTWKRIRSEFCESTASFAADAKTNEFMNLAVWLESFPQKAKVFEEPQELIKAIKTFKAYVENLVADKNDTPEMAAKYVLSEQNLREIILLHCYHGQQEFAIPLLNVIEISNYRPRYALPEPTPGISGVIPYRGEALPVIDLVGHGFTSSHTGEPCFVICEHNGKRFSLEVTKTEDLINLKEADLQNFEEGSSVIPVSFVRQFFIKENRGVMVLDLEKLVA